uniref:FLYWCH-type domain-containing protein n=1 Tax=Anopheles atroparvus TaxID=41427 RepID=A0A182IYE6_ANOAO
MDGWVFTAGQRGKPKLVVGNNSYFRTKGDHVRAYWSCSAYKSKKCRSKIVTHRDSNVVKFTHRNHSHPDEYADITKDADFSSNMKYKCALDIRMETGSKGRPKLVLDGYSFFRNNSNNNKTYWLCSKNRTIKCRARIITIDECSGMILKNQTHNHPPTDS